MSKVLESLTQIFHSTEISSPPVDLDLHAAATWFLTETSKLIDSENIVWILKEKFDFLKTKDDETMTGKSLNIFDESSLVALNPMEKKDLEVLVKGFSGEQMKIVTQGSQLLAPICHPETNKVLAYILVTGVAVDNLDKTTKNLESMIDASARYISYCVQYYSALALSLKDDLTLLYNQKYLHMVIDNEIARAEREKQSFAILFIDIDHFKKVNDKRGHWVGSHLLKELGKLFTEHTRKSDYPFRYGGDEFVMVLPNTNAEQASIVAERLRSKAEAKTFNVDGDQVNITLSIGVALFPEHAKSRKDIIDMADKAMYEGKNKSRNIVLMAG